MIKYVGNIAKDFDELEKLCKEGFTRITERGYAISDDEHTSSDDIIIENLINAIYDDMYSDTILIRK